MIPAQPEVSSRLSGQQQSTRADNSDRISDAGKNAMKDVKSAKTDAKSAKTDVKSAKTDVKFAKTDVKSAVDGKSAADGNSANRIVAERKSSGTPAEADGRGRKGRSMKEIEKIHVKERIDREKSLIREISQVKSSITRLNYDREIDINILTYICLHLYVHYTFSVVYHVLYVNCMV